MTNFDEKRYRIILGDYDWLVLKHIGSKTLLLSESVLFRGYYALEPCDFAGSKAGRFLQTVFSARLNSSGIDTSKISNISVLTLTQYEAYVKPYFPASVIPYILANTNPSDPEQICQVDKDGKTGYIGIREQTGFRPCIYIDTAYLKETTGLNDIVDVASFVPAETDTRTETNATEQHERDEDFSVKDEQNTVTTEETQSDSEDNPVGTSDKTDIISEAEKETLEEAEKETLIESEKESVVSESSEQEQIQDQSGNEAENTVSVDKEDDGTYSVHLYGGEFKPFAMVYDGTDERVRRLIEKQGISISDFIRSSQNENRKSIDINSVMDRIKQNQDRWSWKKK